MNIAFFIQPKQQLAWIYEDDTIRQGLEKMRHYGYTAIPVLNRQEEYLGTISEGDFLWLLCDFDGREVTKIHKDTMEHMRVSQIQFARNYPAVQIDTSMEELIEKIASQNFVPVVDNRKVFCGIVTRSDVIRYLARKETKNDRNAQTTDISASGQQEARG